MSFQILQQLTFFFLTFCPCRNIWEAGYPSLSAYYYTAIRAAISNVSATFIPECALVKKILRLFSWAKASPCSYET